LLLVNAVGLDPSRLLHVRLFSTRTRALTGTVLAGFGENHLADGTLSGRR
jgi:hypothetical protein